MIGKYASIANLIIPVSICWCFWKFTQCYYIVINLNKWSMFADASNRKVRNLQFENNRFFASVSTGEDNPLDFLRIVLGMLKDYCWMSFNCYFLSWVWAETRHVSRSHGISLDYKFKQDFQVILHKLTWMVKDLKSPHSCPSVWSTDREHVVLLI